MSARPIKEKWVTIGERGLHGGILITGSIGSGKTQGTVLPYLSQLLKYNETKPSMLALDPKGTFIKEAEKIIYVNGLKDSVLKISLQGNVSINPVYCERPLKNGKFAVIAEMVRAASANFVGRSGDSPFWEFSSNTLIRNAIIYCAAIYGYFTLIEFYQTLVRASDNDLASELEKLLTDDRFDEEEKFNISRAIEYFRSEYMKMEERVRTGILSTSTVFINQLQEYWACKVFCPKKEDLTIKSMDDVVDSGKLLLFDVQQLGLSRSMGTFVKLLYQQSILERVRNSERMETPRSCILLIDEYQDVVTCGGGGTLGDESFGAKARESKPIIIVATQSLSSLMNAVGNQKAALELIQTFRTKIACHSSDLETINHFKELRGQEDRESLSTSISELSQKAMPNYLLGGFESTDANLTESISKNKRPEYVLTGKEFTSLKTFEAYAQIFDGVETRHLKLFLKPYFLEQTNTKHEDVLALLMGGKEKDNQSRRLREYLFQILRMALSKIKRTHYTLLVMSAIMSLIPFEIAYAAVPNACTVAASPEFKSCLELNIGGCSCGFPPRPCAAISYYVPQTFIEVHPESGSSFFPSLPGTAAQLSKIPKTPYGAEADSDTQSFHAHTIAVPLSSILFEMLPAGGTRTEKMCFDGMSEHLGNDWKTGNADIKQPLFLAWAAAPKACLLTGAAMSAAGGSTGAPSSDAPVCSYKLTNMPFYPPSSHEACNGWGVFYPRSGVYSGPASMTGALMIASRIKSLSAEVFRSIPSSPDEKWQMILPQSSSCFREGQNIGLLETIKNARETKRLINGKMSGYLFVVWKRTQTCKDLQEGVRAQVMANSMPAMCKGLE